MLFLTLGVILNDVSAFLNPNTSLYIAAMHQTSILLVFFSAFLAGSAAMYDIVERKDSIGLGKGIFIYSAIMWCTINTFWATGYYLLSSSLLSNIGSAFNGSDLPFTFGFYTPEVPRLVMIIYNVMNALSVYLIWKKKKLKVALAGIFLPIVYVNLMALLVGRIIV